MKKLQPLYNKLIMKINIGLLGIFIIIILLLYDVLVLDKKIDILIDEVKAIESMMVDIDYDIHQLEKK